MLAALVLASGPCDPFALALRPLPGQRVDAVGWAGGRLLAVRGWDLYRVDVFAHQLTWIGELSGGARKPAQVSHGSGASGPDGVVVWNGELFDATDRPALPVGTALREALEGWPRLWPHGYRVSRVARSEKGEWLVIAAARRDPLDYRVFLGRDGSLREHPVQGLSMGLDGGSLSVVLALDGGFVRWSFPSFMLHTAVVRVIGGPRAIDTWSLVREVPLRARFSCLAVLPPERWW